MIQKCRKQVEHMRTKAKNAEQIIFFHREILELLLKFVKKYNITNIQQLNSYKARKLFDEPLWKLLETEGKYGGRYISEGVHNLELILECTVDKNNGRWNGKLLEKHFGNPPDGDWKKSYSHCCNLDHVSERAKLISLLLQEPERAKEILDQCLVGCVVLKSEHNKLGSAIIEPKDPWRRYREAYPKIRVWDRETENWLSLEPFT